MFIHYEISKGYVKEQRLLNCDHVISVRYVPAHTTGEFDEFDKQSRLEILTTEQEGTTVEVGSEDPVVAATQSTLHIARGEQADVIWDLLLANVNALQPF